MIHCWLLTSLCKILHCHNRLTRLISVTPIKLGNQQTVQSHTKKASESWRNVCTVAVNCVFCHNLCLCCFCAHLDGEICFCVCVILLLLVPAWFSTSCCYVLAQFDGNLKFASVKLFGESVYPFWWKQSLIVFLWNVIMHLSVACQFWFGHCHTYTVIAD